MNELVRSFTPPRRSGQNGVVVQLADGTIQAYNPVAARILGLTLDQLQRWNLSDSPWQAIHADGSAFLGDSHPATITLHTGEPCIDVVMGLYQPSGELIWLRINTEPLLDTADHLYGVLVTFVEIAEPSPLISPHDTAAPPATGSLSEAEFFFERSLNLLSVIGLDGYFKRVNPMFGQTLGYSEAEIFARPFLDFVHPDDHAATLAEVEKLNTGIPTLQFENRYRTKKGDYRWLAWTASPQLDQGLTYCVARDITLQKQTEAALKNVNETLEQRVAERTDELEQINRSLHQSEVWFRTAINYIPDAFVIYDAERRIQFVNAAGLALTERTIADYLGRTDEEVHPPEVTQAYLPLLQQAVATKSYQMGECTITLPNRDPYTIVVQYVPLLNDEGEIQQILGITHNITERKRSEESVRRSEQQVRRVLNSLFSFVGVMTPDGVLIEANRTALEAGALSPEDVLGKPFEQTYWWSYSVELQTQLRAAIAQAAKGEMVRYDAVVRVKDGQLMTIDFTLVPTFDSAGRVEYLIPSGIDISERKQAEIALQQSQAQVQRQLAEIETIYQSAPIGLNVLDTDLRFVRINQRLAEINGMAVEAHLGRTIRELLPDIADTAEALLRPVLETGEPLLNVEIQGETPAQPGVQRVWLESFLPLKDGDRVIGINTVCEEITERKQAEVALRESEQRFRQLAENINEAVFWIRDLQQPRVIYISPAYERIWGRPHDSLYENHTAWIEAIHPDDRKRIETAFGEHNRASSYDEEYRIIRPDGTVRWIRDRAFPICDQAGVAYRVVGLAEDITDRKRAEEAVQESEDRLRLVIAAAQLGTWDWHIVTGELKWDKGCKAMFGLQLDVEANMQVFTDSIHPDDRDRVQDIIQACLDPVSGGAFDIEYRAIGVQDGVERWLRSKGQVFYDPSGTPLRFSGTVLNITEQKQVEAQRERLLHQEQAAREAAERANRMKDEFLAVLSHELRTPLNPILGWSKLLQSPQITAEKLHHGLTTIERNARQQVQLIDDLLDISRIIRGKISLNFTTVALAEPIVAALETVRLSAEAKAIQFSISLDPDVGLVRGDAGRLQQVIWNLLSNAIKFTPTGGRVEVRLDRVDSGQSAVHRQANPAPSTALAQITVSDTGKGIQPNFLPHVFELFRQQDSSTTRTFGGLGLGLAIARQVVEAHGGTITVASAGEGQGATFMVRLPIFSGASLDQPDGLIKPTRNLKDLRVLVVDDEVDSLELLTALLEREGAIVQTASQASAALRLLSQSPFALIISDIGMPEMDGYTFIRQVRNLPPVSNRNIPAIALTAYAGEANRRQILAAGFQAHLAKPLDPQHLLDVIATLITP